MPKKSKVIEHKVDPELSLEENVDISWGIGLAGSCWVLEGVGFLGISGLVGLLGWLVASIELNFSSIVVDIFLFRLWFAVGIEVSGGWFVAVVGRLVGFCIDGGGLAGFDDSGFCLDLSWGGVVVAVGYNLLGYC